MSLAVSGLIRGGEELRRTVHVGRGRNPLAVMALQAIRKNELIEKEDLALIDDGESLSFVSPEYFDHTATDRVDQVLAQLEEAEEAREKDHSFQEEILRDHEAMPRTRYRRPSLSRQEGEGDGMDCYRRSRPRAARVFENGTTDLLQRFGRWRKKARK